MNPPAAHDASAVSPAPRGYGARLRGFREQAGLSIEQVAQQLKLAPRQVHAIEEEDLAVLPEVTYVRGFVRNYARLLNVDAGELLDGLPVNGVEPAQGATFRRSGARMAELPPDSAVHAGWARWVIPLLLLVAVAAFTGYEWFRQQEKRASGSPVMNPAPVVPPAPAGSEPRPGPASGQPSQTLLPNPSILGEGSAPSPAAASAAEPARTGGPDVRSAADAGPAPSPGAGPAAAPGAAPVASGAATSAAGELRLSFAQNAWVEIRDGRGRVLHSQTNPAGSTHVVTGDPPFDLVIGNAQNVKLLFNGQPVDLSAHARANIARLQLK